MKTSLMPEYGLLDGSISSLNTSGQEKVVHEDESEIERRELLAFFLHKVGALDDILEYRLI